MWRVAPCRFCQKMLYDESDHRSECSYHPRLPGVAGNAGPRADYADLWFFPCCGAVVRGDVVEGSDVPAAQSPGCVRADRHRPETGWKGFLGYSRRDESQAMAIEQELRRRGHMLWRDRSDLTVGSVWAEEIDRAIAAADFVAVLLSPNAVASTQVNREVDVALTAGKLLIPILLQDCAIPERLNSLHAVDWRRVTDLPLHMAGPGFEALRQAAVFGEGSPLQEAADETVPGEIPDDRPKAAADPQTLVVRGVDGRVLTVLTPTERFSWEVGHLLAVDSVVYAVASVITHSASSVEVRVRRARMGP